MGSNKRQQRRPSFFSRLFRGRRPRGLVDFAEEALRGRRSDDDKGARWFGEPDIDRKAHILITRFHETQCKFYQAS